MAKKTDPAMVSTPPTSATQKTLLTELRGLIDSARQQVAQTANAALTLLYWNVGQRIRREVLQNGRAEYGEQILPTLSAKLVEDYGQGFSARNLARMMQFAEAFPDENIVATLSQQLSWSHFVEILPLKQPLEREYYAELCRIERWSVRTLRERIASQLYLRTAIAKSRKTSSSPKSATCARVDKCRPISCSATLGPTAKLLAVSTSPQMGCITRRHWTSIVVLWTSEADKVRRPSEELGRRQGF